MNNVSITKVSYDDIPNSHRNGARTQDKCWVVYPLSHQLRIQATHVLEFLIQQAPQTLGKSDSCISFPIDQEQLPCHTATSLARALLSSSPMAMAYDATG